MRKSLLILVAFVVVAVSGYVAMGTGHVAQAVENIRIFINGQEKVPETPPIMVNDYTMVPLRFVAETLGATVDWDWQNSTIDIKTIASSVALNKEQYLQQWDTLNIELLIIKNTIRDMSVSVKEGSSNLTSIGTGDQFNTMGFKVGKLFERLASITPPPELMVLHHSKLKELVLWNTSYLLSAKVFYGNDTVDITSLVDEARQQALIGETLRVVAQ